MVKPRVVARFPWFRSGERRVRHTAHFERVLGTSLELQVVAHSEELGRRVEDAVLAEIDRLALVFNAYRPDSELRKWQETHGEEIGVSAELAGLLSSAEAWRVRTAGAFNPAVEALSRLWAYHAEQGGEMTPDELAPLLGELAKPLWKANGERGMARRLTTLPVTLNSIAKGFIIDAASEVAAAREGVFEVLLNIGGDIRHVGRKGVPIAIADPRADAENAEPADRVHLCNAGVATSGNYRRGFRVGDRWYSHILDPRTGWPVEERVGVSVVAPDAATADVLATAFSILEPAQSLQLADSLEHVGALLIEADGSRHSNGYWESLRP